MLLLYNAIRGYLYNEIVLLPIIEIRSAGTGNKEVKNSSIPFSDMLNEPIKVYLVYDDY